MSTAFVLIETTRKTRTIVDNATRPSLQQWQMIVVSMKTFKIILWHFFLDLSLISYYLEICLLFKQRRKPDECVASKDVKNITAPICISLNTSFLVTVEYVLQEIKLKVLIASNSFQPFDTTTESSSSAQTIRQTNDQL